MTAVVLPQGKQQFFTTAGVPAAGYKLATFDAGTTNPKTTWLDAGQVGANTNPIILDARGEAVIFWNGAYKVQLQDSTGAVIWTVDGVSTQLPSLTQSLIPSADNTYDIGSAAFSWRQIYVGPNDAVVFDTATGNVGYWERTNLEIAAALVPTNKFYPPGHVYRWTTNTTPGTTDMTSAFQSAALTSLTPYAPGDVVKITGSIPLRANQRWTLDGTQIQITGTVVQVFTVAAGINDWAIDGNWSVTGDNGAAGATAGTAAGIAIIDSMRYRVEGFTAKNISGWGVRVQPGASISTRGEKGVVASFQAHACYRGFEVEAGTGAEYVNFDSPILTRCNIGARVAAGNCNVTGGNIVDNTTGVDLVNGSNHGHGIFSGVQINHNLTEVKANTVTNGQTFTGCHFFQGIIHLDHSTGVWFRDGIMDIDEYRFEESDGCGFSNNTMTDGYANTINNDYNASHSYTVWEANRTKIGEPWRGGLGNIKGIRVTEAMTASQVLSAANVNATSVIKMDTKVVASANQASQTTVAYLAAYDVTTGIHTVKKGGDGKARVSGQFVVTYNAADAGKFQCFLTHSVLGDYYMVSEVLSTTQAVFRLDVELPVDLTNTLTFKIGGTGVANNVTITNSGGTKVQVEGL